MPGSLLELTCPACETAHELMLGADVCPGGGHSWSYEHRVCRRCRAIANVKVCPCQLAQACGECGGPLIDWEGTIWFPIDRDGSIGPTRVLGSCPCCGYSLSDSDISGIGNWV